jgi:ribosomal protein S18 acetylase RimI-like enzyme
MIKIRHATKADYPLIHQLAHQIWPHTFREILSEAQIAYMLEMMYSISSLTEQVEKKSHRFLLSANSSVYTGYASCEHNYQGTVKTKIHKIYILPEVQKNGTGKQLMLEIEKMASDAGNTVLTLNVNKYNSAIQFYEHIGFRKVSEENIDIGNGFLMEDFVMEKIL